METEKEKKCLYVLTAAYEYDATVYGCDLIDVFNTQAEAFNAMDNIYIAKFLEWFVTEPVIVDSKPKKMFMKDMHGHLIYCEKTYVKHKSETVYAGSITVTITEVFH